MALPLCHIRCVFPSYCIVDWSIETYKGAKLVIKALMMAFSQRIINFIGIFHSDRGSEYASEIVKKTLIERGFLQSMSGKRNCYDNAVTESFFATVEKECLKQISL